MNKIFYFVILLSFFTIIGCSEKNNPVSPIPSEFDVEYKFINSNDPNILDVEIISLTYYPKVDKTWYRKQNFQNPSVNDTLISYAHDQGYIGCYTQMAIMIFKEWPSDSSYWKLFTYEMDTILYYDDRITVFNWPDDTTRATELPYP
jgi:hypothetical protein